MMTPRLALLLAGLGSFGLLAGAFAFQHIGGLAPCQMCIWQRWPHAVAIALAVLALAILPGLRRPLAGLGALTMAVSAGLGLFHAGVEQKWWKGPGGCSGGIDPSGLSTEDLLAQIRATDVVACDEIVWDLFGISMAGWNGLISVGLLGLWVLASRR